MKNLYDSFEQMLLSHNLNKTKDLMRGVRDMKLLDKVNQEDLALVLENASYQNLWSVLAQIPHATIKSKICTAKTLSNLISNSCTFTHLFRKKEWMHLYLQANINKKIFLEQVSSKDASFLKSLAQYEACNQNLPFDSLKLEHSTIVTPLNNTFLSEVATSLKLCTYDKKSLIGPDHQKMFVFNNENKVIAILTVYTKCNCFAVSGKDNSRISLEIENEIKENLIKHNLLKTNPYLISNQSDYHLVNDDPHNWLDRSLERIYRDHKELVKTIYPDIETKIQVYLEKKNKEEEEERLQRMKDLKGIKDSLLLKLNDPDFLNQVKENLIQQVNQLESKWELRSIEGLIERLSQKEENKNELVHRLYY